MRNSKNLLIIFTRNPELGKVKSRLAVDIGNESALEVYKFLLSHTQKVTKELAVDKQVWYSENAQENDIWDSCKYSKHEQLQVEDLGMRMQKAFEQGFEQGYENIIIIGSDLYDISERDFIKAFESLAQNEAIIGPAEDGGFYLLGMNKMIPELFQNKNWGTSSVLKDTLKDLEKYTFESLEERNDVDYLIDIEHVEVFQPFLIKMSKAK